MMVWFVILFCFSVTDRFAYCVNTHVLMRVWSLITQSSAPFTSWLISNSLNTFFPTMCPCLSVGSRRGVVVTEPAIMKDMGFPESVWEWMRLWKSSHQFWAVLQQIAFRISVISSYTKDSFFFYWIAYSIWQWFKYLKDTVKIKQPTLLGGQA